MDSIYHSESAESKPDPELLAAADHRRELKKLSDISFALLNASAGDVAAAERMLDDFITLLFEGGTLSLWRYRILLGQIREGL